MRTATKFGIGCILLGFTATSISMLEYEAVKPLVGALAYLGTSLGTLGGLLAPALSNLMAGRKPAGGDTLFPK